MAKPPRQSGRRATFTPEAAQRIAKVVRDAERGGSDTPATNQRVSGLDGEAIRGTFTAPWPKSTQRTVTDAIFSSVTYPVKNYTTSITGTGTKTCLISNVSGEWVVIDFDLCTLDGYDVTATKTQVLASVNGILRWIDTINCP